jgi:hypothetical protein
MIPLSLLDRIVDLLLSLDTSDFGFDLRYEYDNILWTLTEKRQKLYLRAAYSKIILAVNADDRDDARVDYLRLRGLLYGNK